MALQQQQQYTILSLTVTWASWMPSVGPRIFKKSHTFAVQCVQSSTATPTSTSAAVVKESARHSGPGVHTSNVWQGYQIATSSFLCTYWNNVRVMYIRKSNSFGKVESVTLHSNNIWGTFWPIFLCSRFKYLLWTPPNIAAIFWDCRTRCRLEYV